MSGRTEEKEIIFDYYKPFCYELNKDRDTATEKIYNLEGILKKLKENFIDKGENQKTALPCMGERARMQIIKSHNNVWEIQMLRLREKSLLSGIADDDGDFKVFTLEDNQYIGESTTLLYDKERQMLLMQRNRDAVTPSGLEEYLNLLIESKGIILKPQIDSSRDLEKIKNKKYFRMLDIGFYTDTLSENNENDNELISVLQKLKCKGANKVDLKITVGIKAKKDSKISAGLVGYVIDDLYENNKTTKLRLKYKENKDTCVEKVDLLDDRKIEKIIIRKEKRESLSHNSIYPLIKNKYIEKNS